MGLFDYKYLDSSKTRGFSNYKYNCIDNSPIALYISHPFWNWFVNFYPTWLAPNVITLVGASLVMGCYFFVAWLDPNLNANNYGAPDSGNIPNWVWLLCSFCTFAAHLLDGTDGKQARRTGASGPTGELFDHGLDSWSTVPFTITIFSIFGRGEYSIDPVHLLGILITVQLVFIVTHWEKYNTGVLFLSWGYDASQYGLSLFYLFTYIVGHKYYQFYVVPGFSFAQAFEVGFYVMCVVSFIMSGYNMYYSYFVDKTGKQENIFEMALPMISPAILFTVSVYWAKHSPNNIIYSNPRLFFWTMGVVFSNIAVRLIIAQMSVTRAELINKCLILYSLVAGLAVSGFLGEAELAYLQLLAFVVTAAHIHYGACVVRQLCSHFKINAFNLDYLKKPSQHKQRQE